MLKDKFNHELDSGKLNEADVINYTTGETSTTRGRGIIQDSFFGAVLLYVRAVIEYLRAKTSNQSGQTKPSRRLYA